MIAKSDIPKLDSDTIIGMKDLSYPEIAFKVLHPFK
jgi:hypothetical protein